MKVIHIVHGKANPAGHNGISRVVYYLNKYEKLAGIDSQIWAIVDGIKQHTTIQRDAFVTVECYPRVTPFSGKDIIQAIEQEKDSISLVHFHLIWFYDKNLIIKAIKRLGIPSIITTHGTYSNPHAYTGKRLLARWFSEKDYLNMANECHLLSAEEGTGLLKYGYKGKSFVVPNGFEPTDIPIEQNRAFFKGQPFAGKRIISMIAVLRKDKNIEHIIQAIALLPKELRHQLAFVLIGPDYKGNAQKYTQLAQQLGVEEHFHWIGPLYGVDKYHAMYSSDGYIMASDSEGFSMAIIDAMACGLPMILTSGCNMKYLSDEKFYIMCEPYAQDLSRAIAHWLTMPQEECQRLGEKAQQLLQTKLNWEHIAPIMIDNYKRIIKNER